MKRTGWDTARYVAALGVAVIAALFFLNSIGEQNLCKDVLDGAKENPQVVQLCEPPRLLDLGPFVLVIALLLWPDLGEFAVTGLVSLKRRVEAQEERQEYVEGRLTEVHQQLAQMNVLSASTTVNNYYAPDQEDVRLGIVEKESMGERLTTQPPSESEDKAALLGQFLHEYAQLEPYVAVPRLRRFSNELLAELTPEQVALVDQWNDMFHEELTAVRQTRNAAVHEPHSVRASTLSGAIANTRELLRILRGRVGLGDGPQGR